MPRFDTTRTTDRNKLDNFLYKTLTNSTGRVKSSCWLNGGLKNEKDLTMISYKLSFNKFASLLVSTSLLGLQAFIVAFAAFILTVIPAHSQDADIVETAVAAGSFQTLAAALGAADLIEPLKGEGPFTVFAPTDEAFAKLPEGTVESLLLPENKETLAAILTYHVVAGSVLAADVVNLSSATTLNGAAVSIDVSENGVMIGTAKVTQTDILASNGVIHVLDSVILPPAATAIEGGSWAQVKESVK